MKITVLVENSTKSDLICEHGLSLFIENKGSNILLDAGSSDAFFVNAQKIGINLKNIDFCVLSHGHYDHSGGFEALLENNSNIKIYAQKSALERYFSGNGGMHEIGIPENVLKYRENFELIDGSQKIDDGIYLIVHNTEKLEEIGEKAKLYKMIKNRIVPDDFLHEQSLVIDTKKGLVIFNSCSHGGMVNIVREVRQYCGGKKILAYIGGLHMKGKVNGQEVCTFSDEDIEALCSFIKKEKIVVYTGHCTGITGFEKMQKIMGDSIISMTTGMTFDI